MIILKFPPALFVPVLLLCGCKDSYVSSPSQTTEQNTLAPQRNYLDDTRLRKKVDTGDPIANFVLVSKKYKGELPADDPAADEWAKKAAIAGYAEAQFYVGARHWNKGGEDSIALKWFKKAAQQKYGPAEFALGSMFLAGSGVLKSEEMAVNYFERAAANGLPSAQWSLAEIYAKRDPTNVRNPIIAYAWANLVSIQDGYSVAAELRDSIRLSEPSRLEAQNMSAHWKMGEIFR